MLIKPEKIYQDPPPSPDVHEVVKQLSFAEKLELYTRLQQEVAPQVTPALGDEEVMEMALDEHERKLDVEEPIEEEKPKINPATIRFNPPGVEYGKPIGWDKPDGWDKKSKKTSIFKIFYWGVIDRDMEVSDYKRYDNLMSWMRPSAIVLSILLIALFIYTALQPDSWLVPSDTHTSTIDRVFNWAREVYDNWFGTPRPSTHSNSQVVMDTPFTRLLTLAKDTPVVSTIKDSTFRIDSSLILIDTIK